MVYDGTVALGGVGGAHGEWLRPGAQEGSLLDSSKVGSGPGSVLDNCFVLVLRDAKRRRSTCGTSS